jgi:hypothetical protein
MVYVAMAKSIATTGSVRRSTRKSASGKGDFRPPDAPAGRQVVEHSPNLETITQYSKRPLGTRPHNPSVMGKRMAQKGTRIYWIRVENNRFTISKLRSSTLIMSPENATQDVRRGRLRGDLWIKPLTSYYSASQVVQWLSCINYKTIFTEEEIASGLFPADLRNLSMLMRLHLVTFPFENTAMH